MADAGWDATPNLKIGAVARASGVSVHTIRKWEERYGAVTPHRTETGKRLYTQGDAERLSLIRRLAERGLSLRDIARYSLDELSRTWSLVADAGWAGEGHRPVQAAVLGTALAGVVARQTASGDAIRIVASADRLADLEALCRDTPVDVVLYESPSLGRDTRTQVSTAMQRLGTRAAVVVYRFGASSDLVALRSPEVAALRAPVDAVVLEQTTVGLSRPASEAPGAPWAKGPEPDADGEVPPPRVSEAAMARLARAVPRIRCECPHHLVDILLSLRAFEDYSRDCENRSPEDADLHHYLWQRTARARAAFEEAIERVAAAEGVSLGD